MTETTETVQEIPQEQATTLLDQQRQLIELELYYRWRQMFGLPGVDRVPIGLGNSAEQTLIGNQQDPYNGVAIFNPTAATLSVGFQAGTGVLGALTVPPFSYACFPERFVNLSIALLDPTEQQTNFGGVGVTVIRLRVPPFPSAGPFGSSAQQGPALAAHNPGSSFDVRAAGNNAIIAANPNRRELTIVNATATGWVYLALGPAAPALGAGVALAPNGGFYSTSEYDGPISAIAQIDHTLLSLAEV